MSAPVKPRQVGVMGRGCIFRPKVKDVDHRYQGIVTEPGRAAFERHRVRLGKIYQRIMGYSLPAVSDSDTIEFLALGELDAVKYLRELKRAEIRSASV